MSSAIKKTFGILGRIVTWIFVVLAVAMMVFTVVSTLTLNQNERNLFGYKAFIVASDSMKATDFAAGDVIISRQVDPKTLEEGDIITFISQNSMNFGEIVTHKIRRLTTDARGEPGFVTYGTTTDTDDETVVTHGFVLGQYQMKIPKVGSFFYFLKTTPGYIICILIPFLVLILSQGINCIRLFRRYKKEQMAELEAERAQIEEERAQSQRMMAELLELKAMLAGKEGGEEPPASGDKTDEA